MKNKESSHPFANIITIFDRYFILLWVKNLLIIFFLVGTIALLIDFIDLSKSKDNALLLALKLALLKNFHTIQIINPFIVLMISAMSYFSLCHRRECMALLSMGASHFSLLKPCLVAVTLYYITSILVLNPLDSFLLREYQKVELSRINDGKSLVYLNHSGLWFKQDNKKLDSSKNHKADGKSDILSTEAHHIGIDSMLHDKTINFNTETYEIVCDNAKTLIINASRVSRTTSSMLDVRIFFLSENGNFIGKVLSPEITWGDGAWKAGDYITIDRNGLVKSRKNALVPLAISLDSVTNSTITPEMLGLWKLTGFIKIATEMGIPTARYQFYLGKHVFMLILYFALAIISYAFIMYIPRISKPHIISSLLCGFLLYFLVEMTLILSASRGMEPITACATIYITCFIFAIFILYYRCLNYQKLKI